MYKKILVATMGEYMDAIIEHTLNLVKGDTQIFSIYVVETSVPFLTPKKVKEMMKDELTERGNEILSDMRKAFRSAHENCEMKVESVLLEGNPADEIVKFATEKNVDVIVMGTGKSIVDKKLLGSVSEKVVHSAPCTILLVRTAS